MKMRKNNFDHLSRLIEFKQRCKEENHPVLFDDEKWFLTEEISYHPNLKPKKVFVISKYVKNFFTLDYHEDSKTLMKFESFSEAKIKAAVLGIDLYAINYGLHAFCLYWPQVKGARRL